MRTVRVFISSPSDVAAERQSARAVIAQLQARFQGQAVIHALFWESQFYNADKYVQEQLEPPSTFDIVVLILWSSLGSSEYVDKRTGIRYASGTRFEIADTLSVPEPGRPKLLVCRCRRKFTIPADASPEEITRLKTNYDAAQKFLDNDLKAFGVLSPCDYLSVAEFATILQETLVDRIKKLLGAGGPAPATRTVEPFKGLRVLTAEDHGFFFGRSGAVHRVVEQFRRQAGAGRPFVLIFGRSGVGKSSFARAGVVPHIVLGNVIEGIGHWRTALFEPSDSTTDLIGGLAAALCAGGALPELVDAFKSVDTLASTLRTSPSSAIPALQSTLQRVAAASAAAAPNAPTGDARLFLAIDPMEEIFTRPGSTPEDVAAFSKALRVLCESGLIWVIGTVRTDFYGPCVEIPDLHTLEDGDGHFNLPPMEFTELEEAVREPAERAGIRFGVSPEGKSLDKELVDAALAMKGEPLPLLAYALQQLYVRSNAAVTSELSWEHYVKLNQLPGLLNASADEARRTAEDRMSGGQEAAWNEVFGQLVTVEANNQRVRLYARKDALLRSENARILVEELDKARLIITDEDDQHNPVITIAHEAMLRQWRALASWIDHRETLLKAARALGTAADEWDRHGRRTDDLTLRDARLTAAEQFVANTQGVHVRRVIDDFVGAHVALRDAEVKRKKTLSRLFTMGVIGAFLITATLSVSNYISLRQSNAHRAAAQQHSRNTDEFANFLMSGVLPKIDPRTPEGRATITEVTTRATDHFKSPPPPGESRADALARADGIVRAARQLADLSKYKHAAELQKLGLTAKLEAGLADPSEKAYLYLALADYTTRSGDEGREFIKQAKQIIRDNPGIDPLLVLDADADDATTHRFNGEYVQAYHDLLPIINKLKNMGPDPNVRRVLDRAVDYYTESLRYAGHVQDGLDYYRAYITDMERHKIVIEPRYQVEYSVFLGLSETESDIEDAIRRMTEAIDASPFQPEDAAQYQYKLARVLIDARRLRGQDLLPEADRLVEASLSILVSKDPNSKKTAKCYETRAKLRLARGDGVHALSDAVETLRIRDAKYKANYFQREYLDARVLYVDCLEAAGRGTSEDAAKARREEARIRTGLEQNEAKAAARLKERPSNFDRAPKANPETPPRK